MKNIFNKKSILSLALSFTSSLQLHSHESKDRHLNKELFSEIKNIRRSVRENIKEGGTELKEMLRDKQLGRKKLSPKEREEKKLAFKKLSIDEKKNLLTKSSELVNQLEEAMSNDERIEILSELIPLLRQLPPAKKKGLKQEEKRS